MVLCELLVCHKFEALPDVQTTEQMMPVPEIEFEECIQHCQEHKHVND
jgi:hypothetical protein